MITLVRVRQPAIRFVSSMVLCICAVLAGGWITVSAAQLRSIIKVSIRANKPSGRKLDIRETMSSCHGTALQGAIGSPLTGHSFLANWSGRPLSNLVDKIQNTDAVRFTRVSLTATGHRPYSLHSPGGEVPAGRAELNENGLGQIALPTVKSSGARAPTGTLSELMRAIAFPNANIIFNLQLYDPAKEPKKQMPVPYDYVKWGYTIYPGWLAVDQAAVALSESMPLLLTPRLCQNGRPAPVDRADWKKDVADVVEVAQLAYKTSKERNFEAFTDISEKLNDACASCHRVYRDVGGTEGSGMQRCQVP